MKRKLVLGLMALQLAASGSFAAVRFGVVVGPRYVPVPAPRFVAPAPVYVAPPVVPVPAPYVVAPRFVGPIWIPGHWVYGPYGRYWVRGYWTRRW
jgi:hypothetical protein